jgi:LmbE family N-acetylglucosaminyl deacetylase
MPRLVVLLATVLALVTSANTPPAAAQQPAPTASVDFTFRTERSRWVPATITGGGTAFELVWPDTSDATWDTALLAIGLATRPAEPAPQPTTAYAAPSPTPGVAAPVPYIEISTGAYTDRQYFRAGESGPRWLNLSHLREAASPGARLTLRAEGLTLGTGATALRLFASKPDLSKNVLVLAPHPDDAEIGTFALYATTRSTVATVTAGNAGSATYEAVFGDDQAAEQYHFKGRIRVIDSITIPWQGGVPPERALNLGYFDARLGTMFETPDAVVPEMYGPNTDIGQYLQYNFSPLVRKGSRQSTWRNLVADIEALLRRVNPAVIAAPHPQLDSHRDHQFTTVALVEALARWRRDVTLLLYTNHADNNRYPYGPAGTLMSLPAISQPVELDRVFSLPVSTDLQRQKLFALESMHDLRYSPTRQYQMAVGEGRAVQTEKPGPGPDITYLRRGPRSNELFFVYDQDTVTPMIDAFLAPWRAKGIGR